MKVQRLISVFERGSDALIAEVNVDWIGVENLKTIFEFKKDDPQMFYPYQITSKEADQLKTYLDNMVFDFEKYIYQLDCFQFNT